MWGFLLCMYAAMAAAGGLGFGAFVAIAGVDALRVLASDAAPSGPGFVVGTVAAVFIYGSAVLLFAPVMHAGLVYLSDEVGCGRPARFSDGWRKGLGSWGRTVLVGLGIGAINLLIACAFLAVFALGAVGIGAVGDGGDSMGFVAGAVGCCGSSLVYVVFLASMLFMQCWEALSIRYALLGDMPSGVSLSTGLSTLRAMPKRAMLLSLAFFGISIAVSLATRIVMVPAQLGIDSEIAALAAVSWIMYVAGYLLSVAAGAGVSLLQYTAWSVFWRDATGAEMGLIQPAPVAMPAGFAEARMSPPQAETAVGTSPLEPPMPTPAEGETGPLATPQEPEPPGER
ncbi:MAG: hypothetical protein FDZ70_08355 [Actinobacteria bacterium]|nr:MAG: hypothetical protein FDZ70_08355 [Actinomycetota bacterium]